MGDETKYSQGVREMRGLEPKPQPGTTLCGLIESRGVSGNFKESKERTELYSLDDGKRTLVVFYRAIDVTSAGLVMKTMVNKSATTLLVPVLLQPSI